MRLAVSKDGKNVEEPKIVSTPQDFKEGMKLFEQLARELLGDAKPKAVAGGVAGPLDKEKTMLVNSPHIPGWVKKPLKEELEKRFAVSVSLENDAVLAGMGEAVEGAGKERSIVVYMTVSTGVGGVRIVDKKAERSAMGFEPGHQVIDQGMTLEQLVSGTGVKARYNKDPREIQDEKIWDELARLLAIGLNNTIVHWSPDIVVLGGAMILGNPAIPLDKVRKHLKDILTIFPELPPLRKAALGDAAGLYGALELAKQHV